MVNMVNSVAFDSEAELAKCELIDVKDCDMEPPSTFSQQSQSTASLNASKIPTFVSVRQNMQSRQPDFYMHSNENITENDMGQMQCDSDVLFTAPMEKGERPSSTIIDTRGLPILSSVA